MNLRTTLVLLAVVAALAAAARWFDRSGEAPEASGVLPRLVGQLPGGKAVRAEILLATGQDLVLERRGLEWWIVEPFEDRASLEVVAHLMEILRGNPIQEVERDPSPDRLGKLGLEPPTARVTLYGPEGEPVRLRVGRRDATRSFTHVLYEGDRRVFRTGANLLNVLEKARQEWRDPCLVGGDATMVRRFELRRPGEPAVVLERPGTSWVLERPVAFPADDSVVNPLVHGLLLVTVDRFVKVGPTEEDLAAVGLTPATAIEVRFDWGGRRVSVRFGPPENADPGGRRYAVDSERGHLFLVRGDALRRLETPAVEFRDPHPVRVTLNELARLVLERPGLPTIEIVRDDAKGRFRFLEPFERLVDDGRDGALRGFLVGLSRMEAEDFLDREALGEPPDGGDPIDALMERRLADLALALREPGGVRRVVRLSFADGGDAVFVRRPDRASASIYVVPRSSAAAVLEADPRPLLDRSLFPEDLLSWKEVRLSYRGATRTLRRDPTKGAEFWRDPADPERDTQRMQQFVAALAGQRVQDFLPRDPIAEDGLEGPEAAVIEVTIRPRAADGRILRVVLGRPDETGSLVRGTSNALPPRTVFLAEKWWRDRLVALFEEER